MVKSNSEGKRFFLFDHPAETYSYNESLSHPLTFSATEPLKNKTKNLYTAMQYTSTHGKKGMKKEIIATSSPAPIATSKHEATSGPV